MRLRPAALRSRFVRMCSVARCQPDSDDLPGWCETERMSDSSAAPAGFHSVTPRIVVSDAASAVEFMRTVFGATGSAVVGRPAEMRIGDSVIMVSEAGEREIFPGFLYIYVDDADAVYRRALGAGAISVEEPWDTPYGDRRATVRDAFRNLYQIASRPSDSAFSSSTSNEGSSG